MNGQQLESVHPRVAAVLATTERAYRIHEHRAFEQSISSPSEFAECLGVAPARITKTLFVVEQQTARRAALLCCSSVTRVDLKRVAQALNYGRLQMASETQLNEELLYPRHGVSPLGVPAHIPILLDADLSTFPTVWIGSGVAAVEIELAPQDLQFLCQATLIMDVARTDD